MPDRAALQRGREFESEAAEALGLSLTLASGNQPHDRSDARGRIRLSCKASPKDKMTWGEIRAHLLEAIDLAAGTGEPPALAFEQNDGSQYFLMRLSDAGAVLTEEARVQRQPSRGEIVRDRARLPALLRED